MNRLRVAALIGSVSLLAGIILGFFLARQTRYAEINKVRFRGGALSGVGGGGPYTVESLVRANEVASELLHLKFRESEIDVVVTPVSESSVHIIYFSNFIRRVPDVS